MDRHHGSGGPNERYRNSSNSQYSSAVYPSRNYDHSHQQSRGRGGGSSNQGWSSERNNYSGLKDYDRYSSERGTKRRYDQSFEPSKKSYDHHGHNHDSLRSKHHRTDSSQNFEGRSNQHPYHRAQQYEERPSSKSGRYHSYDKSRPSSHGDGSYHQSLRSSNENRRYPQHLAGSSSSGSHRGSGGYQGSRGRGRGRGANRSQGIDSHHLKEKDFKKDTTENSLSRSPNRMSPIANESVCASDVPSLSPSRQPSEINQEELPTEIVTAANSDGGRSTRETDNCDKEIPVEPEKNSTIKSSDASKNESDTRISSNDITSKSEVDSSPKRKNTTKEIPDHFIRLQCPHCNQRSVTFREYILHLSSQRHAKSLEKVSQQHRMSLAKLRTRQRKEQLQIEAQSSKTSHSSRMNFCAICKLCHSESRPNHETTELHKIIKNFLMPYCPICRVNFKSRMLYEKHVATLTHIKNKINMEKTYERRREKERKNDRNGLDKDELVFDLENFMTLDAVGSVDGDGDNGVALEESPIGQEFVKKVEAFFCEVCQRYLSRVEPLEKGLEFHCRSRSHHRAYEERQNGGKAQNKDVHTENDDSQDLETSTGELKRTESQELLLMEAEKDIGGLCDMIGKDDQTQEESESDQNMEEKMIDEHNGEKEEIPANPQDLEIPEVRIKCEKE